MGRGHRAAILSQDPQLILDFANAVEAGRIVVNAPSGQGAAGFGTQLPPTFTIGTGYFRRSSIAENIGPEHLLQWTKVAFTDDPGKGRPCPGRAATLDPDQAMVREEFRRIIVDELRGALKS